MLLAKEEGLLIAVIENAVDGVILIDSSGIIQMVNPAACILFGYNRDELINSNVSVLMSSPHRAKHDGYIHAYHRTNKANIIGIGREVEGLNKSGFTFPFWLSISEIKIKGLSWFTGFIHDLTEKKASDLKLLNYANNLEKEVNARTSELDSSNKKLKTEISQRKLVEQELVASQSIYKAIAHNFPNGVINVFDKDLNYVFADGRGLTDAAIRPSDLVGSNFIKRLNGTAAQIAEFELRKVLEGEQRVFEISQNNNFFIMRAVPLHNSQGEINQVLLVETNITPQKQAEEEIYRSLQKEKELNEMKSRFVSMASHEFRTPLSTILSSAALIAKYNTTELDSNRQKHIERIKSNVNNLNMILQDFLSLEKLDEGLITTNVAYFDCVQFVKEAIEEIEGILKPNQRIICNSNEPIIRVEMDKHLLRNVLNNVLSNASKYSDVSKEIQVDLIQEKQKLLIHIKDQGMGIPSKDIPQLFTRFFRAGNSGNIAGTGLGLHIVKKYVDLMDGNITFVSELNKGTTFTLSFNN